MCKFENEKNDVNGREKKDVKKKDVKGRETLLCDIT